MHTHTNTHTKTHAHTLTHRHTHKKHTHTLSHTQMHTHTQTRTHTHRHTHTHTDTHTHTQTHTLLRIATSLCCAWHKVCAFVDFPAVTTLWISTPPPRFASSSLLSGILLMTCKLSYVYKTPPVSKMTPLVNSMPLWLAFPPLWSSVITFVPWMQLTQALALTATWCHLSSTLQESAQGSTKLRAREYKVVRKIVQNCAQGSTKCLKTGDITTTTCRQQHLIASCTISCFKRFFWPLAWFSK